jgi:hypothetical protein
VRRAAKIDIPHTVHCALKVMENTAQSKGVNLEVRIGPAQAAESGGVLSVEQSTECQTVQP